MDATCKQRLSYYKARLTKIASYFGVDTGPDIELSNIKDQPKFTELLVELMRRKCVFPDGDSEELDQLMLPALEILLDSGRIDIYSLDLSGLVSFSPRERRSSMIATFLSRLSARFTYLKEFIVTIDRDRRFPKVLNLNADPVALGALSRMSLLQILQLDDFNFQLQTLLPMCEKMPSLRFLSVSLIGLNQSLYHVTRGQVKNSLKHLRAFLFTAVDMLHTKLELKHLCLETLPRLLVVGEFASHFSSYRDFRYIPDNESSSGSLLQHLTIYLDHESTQNIHLKFPNVTHLKIDCIGIRPGATTKPFLQFSNIKGLHLDLEHHAYSRDILSDFFNTYGQRVLELYLNESWGEETTSVQHITQVCPNLEKLKLCCLKMDSSSNLNFMNLKQLELTLNKHGSKGDLLTILMAAQFLEKLKLIGVVPVTDDINELSTCIAAKELLLHLRSLEIHMQFYSMEQKDDTYFRAYAKLVKVSSNSLRGLRHVRLFLNQHVSYLAWARDSLSKKEIGDSSFKNIFVDHDLIDVLEANE